jgi:DNA-binding NarL/FixJ family response regulator
VRVVVADDSALIRAGLAMLLREAGLELVGEAGDADALMRLLGTSPADAAIIDIRMPPSFGDEGIQAAARVRREHPGTGVLVLSQYTESSYAMRLVEENPTGVGYLLKDRVTNASILGDALQRLVSGECLVDPTIVTRLLARSRHQDPVDRLTDREREVLALMAEGRSNGSICALLHLSPKTVETHVSRVFSKLGLGEEADGHRRVLAVLAYLRQTTPEVTA